jgi:hypothetical protein
MPLKGTNGSQEMCHKHTKNLVFKKTDHSVKENGAIGKEHRFVWAKVLPFAQEAPTGRYH